MQESFFCMFPLYLWPIFCEYYPANYKKGPKNWAQGLKIKVKSLTYIGETHSFGGLALLSELGRGKICMVLQDTAARLICFVCLSEGSKLF